MRKYLGSGDESALIALFVSMFLVGCVRERITDYYDNGQKSRKHSEGPEFDGPVTWWYENGRAPAINYKDGKKDGPLLCGMKRGRK